MVQLSQQRISDAERRLGELLESAPDAILELDGEGRIALLNRMAENLFGYTREELLGQPVEMLVPEALGSAHQRHRAQYLHEPVTRPMGSGLNLEARRKDGSHFPVEISLSPVKAESGFSVTAIIRDITARARMESQLRAIQEKYIRELELHHQEALKADYLKTEFLTNMSHELRSPLHTILGFSELLAEETKGQLGEKHTRFLNLIHSDSLHLLDLINDLLDLNKIESGRLELQYEAIHMPAVMEQAVSSVRQRAMTKAVDLRTNGAIPTTLFADRLRFKQIMHNLLSNAVKFTQDGGTVWIESAARDGFIEVSVSDTGVGIPEDQQEAVFDKFHQARTAARSGCEGTGLGLAITKRLVEQHGGRIWLQNRPGGGSCFTFTIPSERPA